MNGRKPIRRGRKNAPPVRPSSRRGKTVTANTIKPEQPRVDRPRGQDETIAVRRAKALELRKAGANYRRIVADVGVSLNTAGEDVQAELAALREVTMLVEGLVPGDGLTERHPPDYGSAWASFAQGSLRAMARSDSPAELPLDAAIAETAAS